MDITDSSRFRDLVAEANPDEIYNLAGVSSVSASFAAPWETWRTNADAVVMMLEVLRQHCPTARFYQSSSSEMYGYDPAGSSVHDEDSVMAPVSPYGAAKAAAHALCQTYRRAFGLRVSCGILFNHESSRRREGFLTRKVVDHVRTLRSAGLNGTSTGPLEIGDPSIMRDWGFAPDFVDGIVRVNRQVAIRSALSGVPESDDATSYRDYILGTGVLHSVQQLVDRAFQLAGFELEWEMDAPGQRVVGAHFANTDTAAVIARDELRRPADPRAIRADPSRAQRELGWAPRPGLDRFLDEMLNEDRTT